MTQEEKAKAYDEALERAKEIHNVDMTDSPHKEIAEYIFPVLKESEDERIRKAIIGYIDHGQHYGVSNEEMIAWLEKQKLSNIESNREDWSEEDIDKLTTYLHEKDGGVLWRKAKETAIEICDILKPQPKQEWSKEDEEEFMSLIGYMSYNGMYDSINFLRRKLNK